MAWTFATLKVGDKDSISKNITADVVAKFADVSNDHNPLHLDEAFAKTTRFGQRIAHGMIGAGLISAVHGTLIPGQGAVYMTQSLKFRAPVFYGDTLTAWAEVKEKIEDKKRVVMKNWVVNQKGETVVEGEGLLLFDV
ncbi:MAG: MaoC family dehydratase [Deltaproteobacteria bacterium]|jgi:3-hydroxybutyryl-CoA dehydratase|nr:MaoC family dehydratase [Deltaproteobacteria bacterium]